MMFFVGLHQPHEALLFQRAMISVNRLWKRKTPFIANDWILDSGAFSTLRQHGSYLSTPDVYLDEIRRWAGVGNLVAAVTQDYMCEPFMVAKTGLSIREHQELTIDRYQIIRAGIEHVYIMPVLQGQTPEQYVAHARGYGKSLGFGQWTGVGSVCKRNGSPNEVLAILRAIHRLRPDLRLHGFGLKTTSLACCSIRKHLYSADSMAWSFAARREGRGPDANSWEEAAKFVTHIEKILETD